MGMLDGEGRATGDFLKFQTVGTVYEFDIVTLPPTTDTGKIEWKKRTNNFGKDEEVAFIGGVLTDGTECVLALTRGSTRVDALAAALSEAKADLAVGGRLEVEHHETKDTGKGNALKLYRARYTPPVPATTASLDEF